MEVLYGNQSELGHARRKQDRTTPEQRCLHWLTRSGDILLYPHSPLAIADVLASESGSFDLVATLNNEQHTDVAPGLEPSVVSMHQRKRKKNPRNRANLLTQHPQDSLLQTCKQIQIDNALVKKAGLRRLYLAAGFLTLPTGMPEQTPIRAPLMFYPATLVRKQRVDAASHTPSKAASVETHDAVNSTVAENSNEPSCDEELPCYEVRIDSTIPDANIALREYCQKHADFELPEFDPAVPLQDYFALVASAIASFDGVELEFNIALGNSAPPAGSSASSDLEVRLPDLPAHFDPSLAMAITGDKNLQQLYTVLHLLNDVQSTERDSKLDKVADDTTRTISDLHQYAKKLSAFGLNDMEFRHLPVMPSNILTWISQVNKALDSKIVRHILSVPELSARHLIRLAGVIELIDKAPLFLESYKHPDLCFAATPAVAQRARHQAGLIEDELRDLQQAFVLDKVPAKKQLLNLIEELGGTVDRGPDIVDADYFNARRQFMEFSIDKPANLTASHRRSLGQLAKVLRFRELFVNNTEYRLALGPGYRGLRTDWEALDEMVSYSQEFANVLESESMAASALSKWEEFRRTYVAELDSLQIGAEALRKLLWVCGTQWQSRSADDLLERAQTVRKKLTAWANEHADISSNASKTPGGLLAQFTGKSQQDVITEIHVGETQATISKHINGNGVESAAVIDTLAWLREASKQASEHSLDIEAIVEHWQIA